MYLLPFQFLTLLTFSEFQELLDIVTRVTLSEIDQRLVHISNMSMTWYQGLARVLVNKYPENHRYFSSPDGLVQYVVSKILRFLDFLLFEISSNLLKFEQNKKFVPHF